MRMPLMQFMGGGDPKFMIAITLLFIALLVQLIRKRKLKHVDTELQAVAKIDRQMANLSFTILMLSAVSLLLGFLHSFYFIGQQEGINPKLLYSGVSRTLISPTYGLIIFTISKWLIALSGDKLRPAKS